MSNYVESKVDDFKVKNTAKVSVSQETLDGIQDFYDKASDDEVKPLGGREAELRDYLKRHYSPLDEFTPQEIAKSELYTSLSKPLSSVRTYLRKLAESGEVKTRKYNGKYLYRLGDGVPVKLKRNKTPGPTIERREKLKAFIRQRPYGKVLTNRDVRDATGLSDGSASMFLARMVKDGELFKHEITPFRHYYVVAEASEPHGESIPVPDYSPKEIPQRPRISGIDSAEEVAELDQAVQQASEVMPTDGPSDLKTWAMLYVWDNSEDAGAIKRFIEWLER